ncbi:hypothetical protein PO124_18595 [Bacillus licheniformis]|nr:hypothetical protein [Bacillus licheniformis]
MRSKSESVPKIRNIFPSPGRITDLKLPEQPNVRHECAAAPGMTITPYYDPMIAKMIVKGSSREEAICTLAEALSQYQVKGIKRTFRSLKTL